MIFHFLPGQVLHNNPAAALSLRRRWHRPSPSRCSEANADSPWSRASSPTVPGAAGVPGAGAVPAGQDTGGGIPSTRSCLSPGLLVQEGGKQVRNHESHGIWISDGRQLPKPLLIGVWHLSYVSCVRGELKTGLNFALRNCQ